MPKSTVLILSAFLFIFLFSSTRSGGCCERSNHAYGKGIPCAACHRPKNEITYPNLDQYTQCHNPINLPKNKGVKAQNPHTSPHYRNKLDFSLFHTQHSAPENYCAQCHRFDFKVK